MLDGFVHPDKAFMPFGIQLTPGLLALSLLLLIAIQSAIRFIASMTIAKITEVDPSNPELAALNSSVSAIK